MSNQEHPTSEENASHNLFEALTTEMERVSNEVLPAYQAIGMPGIFAATMMRNDLLAAARALGTGDVVAMIHLYKSLQGYKV